MTLTTRVQNTGATLDSLTITQVLPHAQFVYVPGLSVVTLPNGAVLSGGAADPAIVGSNLVWDFSSAVSSSSLNNILITEVFYDPTNAVEDAHEWIELYNPASSNVDLTGWSIRDALPGQADALPPILMTPGEFVVVAASTNAFLAANPGYTGRVFEVADGTLGSGLNNFADGVFLRNAVTANVDAVSYGGSTAAFNPGVNLAADGQSIQRSPANQDNNNRNDWSAGAPGPGTGLLLTGINNGSSLSIVYRLEVACGAPAGQVRSFATYRQPAGGTLRTNETSIFITVNPGDLTVTKTPVSQNAGVGDTVVWTVTVKNEGFGNAPNVVITDTIGAGLEFDAFSVGPTNAGPFGSTVQWDATVIPALTNLAPQQEVSIVVTATMVGCTGLFNTADARWGCRNLVAVPDSTCEDTALLGETAGASILLIDRYPFLTAALVPAPVVPLNYCTGAVFTLYVTNAASGPTAGQARNVRYFVSAPEGYTVSGPTVDGLGFVGVGDLPVGASTSVTFTLRPGGTSCPLNVDAQNIFLYGLYDDACGNPFFGAPVFSKTQLADLPWARVSKIMPSTVDPSAASFPVTVLFAYSNFVNYSATIFDVYPASTNLIPANITAGGVLNTNLGRVTWNPILNGTGVFTARFDMVFLNPCAGPYGLLANVAVATNITDCQGCPLPVLGSGIPYFTDVTRSTCFTNGLPGGTGNCAFASTKSRTPDLVEVCTPVQLTHRFTSFSGPSLPTNWNGVVFTSSLANARGYLFSTSSVQVLIDGSNVTPFVSITSTNPGLVIQLDGLNASTFTRPGLVASNLVFIWEVATTNIGTLLDRSALTIQPCGTLEEDEVWEAGQSELTVTLESTEFVEACGFIDGRIDLAQWPSPVPSAFGSQLFPSYDVEVILDLDVDNSGTNSYAYVAGSTVYANFFDLAGAPVASVEPALVSNRLVWSLGDLRTNGVGFITYRLRAPCSPEPGELQVAQVRFNNRCEDGLPPGRFDFSATNTMPLLFPANLSYQLKPEIVFLQDNTLVYTLDFLNSGAATAFNVTPEFIFPSGVTFTAANVAPASVSATNAVWTLAYTNELGALIDADGDGVRNDLPPGGTFSLVVTSTVIDCLESTVRLRATHGCGGDSCQVPVEDTASFVPLAGSLVTRTVFPSAATLCATNTARYEVRNSGLIVDRVVEVQQLLPTGMTYIAGSARYVFNGVTNAASDPSGTTTLTFTETNVPPFAALLPGEELAILYDVYVGCDAVFGNNRFEARGQFVDICGNVVSNQATQAVMPVDEPVLNLTKEGRNPTGLQTNFITGTLVADPGDTVVYRLTLAHDPSSEAPVFALELTDLLPSVIRYDGASVTPDAVITSGPNVQLVWSNSTLLGLVGGGPWSEASLSNISILVTGTVTNCVVSIPNQANVVYGCDPGCLSLSDSVSHTLSSEVNLDVTAASALQLTRCGGTRTLVITNLGGTATGLIVSNNAPAGYIFTTASITGEFNAASLNLVLTGTPVGAVALIDLSSAASSGATDVDDDAADGLGALDLGYRDSARITLVLVNDGTGLDCLADPTDLDFADPDPAVVANRSATSVLSLNNLCAGGETVSQTANVLPNQPDPDIDLQANSIIVTNGQQVLFTATVRNIAEQGNAENLHIRLRFGSGWTNLTFVSSNIVSSGASALLLEQQGDTNVLASLPGVILDPVDDVVQLVYRVTAVQGAGPLSARAEVVGVCLEPGIVAACAFTNTLGEIPLANSMTGSVIGAVNGVYYGFDQDQSLGLGYTLAKTVRYDEEAAPGGASRTARIGEDLIYRIRAEYFGQTFSNVVVTESLPTNLVFGTPVDAGSSTAITNWVWNPVSGAFTLPSPITGSVQFVVDIPVIVSNMFANQGEAGNQTIITNVADSTFTVGGATNVPTPSSTTVPVLEPNLSVVKSVSVGTNAVQAGDVILFSNVVSHTALSLTNAYDVFFTDTLPAGLTFSGLDLGADGIDNDGDGLTDEPDEATLVSGATINVTTNNNPNLFVLATNQSFAVVFPALVTNQIAGTTVTNVSTVQWTSLPSIGTNGNERTGDDGTNGLNNYVTSGSVPVRYRSVIGISKSFVATSQTNTLDGVTNQLTIGERIVYDIQVQVPQGIISTLTVTDLVPAGLDWVGGNSDSTLTYPGLGYRLTVPNPNLQLPTNAPRLVITDPDPTPNSSTSNDGSGDDIVFNFGTVTNVPDGDVTNDFFVLSMEFVLLNEAANDGTGPTFTSASNVVQVSEGTTTLLATSPVYQVVDLDLGTGKSASPTRFDAGDTITFSVTVSNRPFNLARAAAYDVLVTDFLPNGAWDTSTAAVVSTPDGWDASFQSVSTGLIYRLFTTGTTALAIGQNVTGRFSIVAGPTVSPNLRLTNRVDASADTIYGPTPTGIVSRSDTANGTTVLTVTNLLFAKSLESTGETGPVDSSTTNVQVGEFVTYRLTATLPEVTVTNLVITDDIPAGMSYILGSARVDTNAFAGSLGALTVDAPLGPSGTLAPNSSNVTIRFAGASTVTGDNDPTNNSFFVLIDAVVLNTNGVTGLPGSQTILTNSATLTYTGNPSNAVPSGVVVTPVIEPRVSIVKTITNTVVDAGDRIAVNLVVTNAGLATAYNLEWRDALNPVFFDPLSVSNTALPAGFLFAVETNTVVVRSDTNAVQPDGTLPAAGSLLVSFEVTISSNIPPNARFTNLASVVWDSIANVRTIDQQRVYGPTNSVDALGSPNLTLAKTLARTSETGPVDTAGTNVTIGEVATYRLTVTLPESTITNLTVADNLPVGMAYWSNVVVDTAGFGGTLPGAPVVTGGGGSGVDVTFTFNGLTVVDGDNVPGNNSFAIEFDAMVLDVAANDGWPAAVDGDGTTTLPNSATVTYTGNPSNPVPSGVVNVQVLEPALLINKTMTPPTNGLVVFTLAVTNRGLSTAFDVVVTDVVRSVWFDTTTLAPVTTPAGFTYAAVGAPGDATITYASDSSSGQPTNSIEVGEVVTFRFSAVLLPGLVGRVTNTAVVSEYTTTDGPNPDERTEPPTNSTALLELPSFTVTKTLTSPTGRAADVGESVTFRLTVTNTGSVGFSTVALDDTFDTNILAFASATPAETGVSGALIQWANVGPLAVGRATNVFVTFTALASTLPGDTTNTVVASLVTTNGGPLPPQTSSAPVVVARPSYLLSKERVEPSGVATQGQTIVFRLSVTNNGEVGLNPVRLDDTYDSAVLSFSSASPAENSAVPGLITWNNVGPLPVGGTAVVTVRYTAVSSTWPGDTTNVVVSTVSTTNGTPLAPQTSSAPAQVAAPAIGLIKLAGSAPEGGIHFTNAGSDVVYTYVVTNRGDTHLSSVTVTDDVLGVIGTVPGVLAPGDIATLFFTSSIPAAVTNLGTVFGTPSFTNGLPIPGLTNVVATNDAIVRIFAALGDFVWLDANRDGIQSGGSETGIPGVVVTLYDPTTNALNVTTTDVNGAYFFTNLLPGAYFVVFAPPPTYALTLRDVGGDGADSDPDPVTGFTALIDLESGEYDPTWDAGLFQRASLGDFVWNDLNADGVQDGGETGFPNVVVNLLTNGTVIASTTTDVSGAYAFTNLFPGTYVVEFELPTGAVFSPQDNGADTADSDADTGTGRTDPVTLVSGENNPTLDAGLYFPASLGDFVWLDVNRDGIQGGGSETGIPDVVVTLYNTFSNVLGITTTDLAGAYAFTNLTPGFYFVGFTPPPGYEFTQRDQGGDDTLDSDANPANGEVSPVTLISGENNPTLDAGLFQRASLGDFVWLDANRDGIQSGGSETGLPDVVVTLYDAQSNVLNVTTTDVNGAYAFTNLVPDTYFVGFAAPTGFELTLQDVGVDTTDSDADPVSGFTAPVTLISGENNPTLDAGLFQRASLGDFVWLDVNFNGQQDGGSEIGVSNVTVTLYDAATNVLDTTATDDTGFYQFTNLLPGTYLVGFTPPAGLLLTLQDLGSDATDSDADPVTGLVAPVTLVSGENNPTLDAGLYQRASLGDFVWNDLNADGVQDGGETGFPNVVVNLLTNGTVIASTTTDVSGAYAFTNLFPGDYVVEFELPTGAVFSPQDNGADTSDSDADTGTGRTDPVTLVSGENNPTLDAGLYFPASLGDFVWLDVNRDGIQGGGSETGIPDVVVTLYDAQSNALNVTTTDVNGAYAFTNLVPDTYFVGFAAPTGFELTLQDVGGDTADSDADPVSGFTAPVTLISGENNPTLDAGLFQRASLGDFVWLDANRDGIQSGGSETGLPDVVVTLYDAGNAVIGVTTTDVAGAYAFTNLVPGTYTVGFTLPPSFEFTLQDVGGDAADSDADPGSGLAAPVTLISGENNPTLDAGLFQRASLGDFAWHDIDGNGVQDGGETGLVNVAVSLLDAESNVVATTFTDATGFYSFTNLLPGVYAIEVAPPATFVFSDAFNGGDAALDSNIDPLTARSLFVTLVSGEYNPTLDAGLHVRAALGNFVWLDVDGNGLQDGGGETGIPDVVVNLYNTNGIILATTTTDVSGVYLFTNLMPAFYYVGFEPPTGYQITRRDTGIDNELDSDPDPVSGLTVTTQLFSAQVDLSWDAGLYLPASLGNQVFNDLNYNSILDDPGEITSAVTGLVVNLYLSDNTFVTSTVTDATGVYLFTNLPPGSYVVEFTKPTNFVFVTPVQGGDAALDSDADQTTGRTPSIVLVSGQEDLTWDAGIAQFGALGDFVWWDLNNDGLHNENLSFYGLDGVTVRLFRVTGGVTSLLSSAVTATDTNGNKGRYFFPDLEFGQYFVQVVTNGVPNYLRRRTTVLNYTVIISPEYTFFDADFGFNTDPTPITLASFTATREGGGVRLAWETASEFENLGFHLYRATSAEGPRTRLTDELIPGQGTGEGGAYAFTDDAAPADTTWFYWLEDVSWSFEAKLHGPVVVRADEPDQDAPVATFEVNATEPGLYRITYEALEAAGLPVASLETERIKLLVNGEEIAIAVYANGATLKPGNSVLFYVPAGEGPVSCELQTGADALRMGWAYAAPKDEGDLWTGSVQADGQLPFTVTHEWQRYLLMGFEEGGALVLDVTDPRMPVILFGHATLNLPGQSGVYLSHDTALPAQCIAVQHDAVRAVRDLKKP